MSGDKVRRVSLKRQHFRNNEYFERVVDDPNGTHYLVEAEVWERVDKAAREAYQLGYDDGWNVACSDDDRFFPDKSMARYIKNGVFVTEALSEIGGGE